MTSIFSVCSTDLISAHRILLSKLYTSMLQETFVCRTNSISFFFLNTEVDQ